MGGEIYSENLYENTLVLNAETINFLRVRFCKQCEAFSLLFLDTFLHLKIQNYVLNNFQVNTSECCIVYSI